MVTVVVCINKLSHSFFPLGVLSFKHRCVLSIVSCIETVFSKLALKFSVSLNLLRWNSSHSYCIRMVWACAVLLCLYCSILLIQNVIHSRGPFEKWQFSLLFHEEVFQSVDLGTVQFLSSDSLHWLSQILHYASRKSIDARTVHELLSEGLRLATDYAMRLSLVTSVSIPLVGSLISLSYEEVYDGSMVFIGVVNLNAIFP